MDENAAGQYTNGGSQVTEKEAAHARAMDATQEQMTSEGMLRDADIATMNRLNRLARSKLMTKAADQGIWFDNDFNPPDPGSDTDPDDPWHQHAPLPIDTDDPWTVQA
jgi:hypothetical protein